MDTRPYLQCLGRPVLFSPAGEPIHFRTKKHLALLVYLALEPSKQHRRDRLAELLWPKATMPEARHSLATGLSVLRPRVGPGVIEATREHVRVAKARLSLDIDRLESGEILGNDTHDALQVAGFLEGLEISDSPEFGLWKDRKAATLLPAIKAALVQLIDQCRRTADARKIEEYADAMLALDELSEEAVRAKMEARAFAGDRLTALRVFEEWRTRLRESVGAQPSVLIEGMAVRLRRRGWERTDTSDIPPVLTDQWRGHRFVGRSEEYRVLYETWELTKRRRARHALVLGDSGVGKSTLVSRFATAAGLEGAAVSRAQCYDLEKEIPYAALGHLVLGLLDLPGVSATPPEILAELARYFKDVERRFPNIPAVEESQGETARLRLTDAFHQTIATLAEEHPVVIVVDDLHLCDEASLSVLHLVIHRVATQPIMLVLVARPGELPRTPVAARLRANAHALGIQELEVPPLSEQESNEVLRALLGSAQDSVDPALRRAMVRVAGGFPMVLELLVQDWKANGSQSLALALDSMTVDFGSTSEAPDLYRRVLDRLVFALDHGTRHVLNVAAVLGHRLNDLSLYAIADLGPGQVMAAMADLVRCRVLRDGGRGLEFVNEFVRAATYLEVPSPVRRALHSAIAARLIEEDARGVRFLGLEIAWHAIRAGQTAELASHLMRGASEAASQGALDAAAWALRTALPQLAHRERAAAALLLAEVLQEQGRWTDSAAVLDAECQGEPSDLSTVFSILAAHKTTTQNADRAVRAVRHLQMIINSDRPPTIRLKAAGAAAQLMDDLRECAIAQALLEAVAVLPEEDLTEDQRTQLGLCRAQFLYYAGRQEEALAVVAALATQLESKGMANSRLVRIYSGLGALCCYEGRYDDAKAVYLAGYALALRIGNEQQQRSIAGNLALCCMRLGEHEEQLRWNATAGSAAPTSPYQQVQTAYHRGLGLAMLGQSSSAIEAFDAVNGGMPPEGPLWLVQAWRLHRADVLLLCGQQKAAFAQAREGLELPHPMLHAPSLAGAFARWLACASDISEADVVRSTIADLCLRMKEFDTLDRIELICARLAIGEVGTSALQELLGSYLSRLPAATVTQLQRLGAFRLFDERTRSNRAPQGMLV